jgi:hypothetical protein
MSTLKSESSFVASILSSSVLDEKETEDTSFSLEDMFVGASGFITAFIPSTSTFGRFPELFFWSAELMAYYSLALSY